MQWHSHPFSFHNCSEYTQCLQHILFQRTSFRRASYLGHIVIGKKVDRFDIKAQELKVSEINNLAFQLQKFHSGHTMVNDQYPYWYSIPIFWYDKEVIWSNNLIYNDYLKYLHFFFKVLIHQVFCEYCSDNNESFSLHSAMVRAFGVPLRIPWKREGKQVPCTRSMFSEYPCETVDCFTASKMENIEMNKESLNNLRFLEKELASHQYGTHPITAVQH